MNDTQERSSSNPSPSIDESRFYNRGVKVEAKVCKVHFTAWRRNLHRGCENEDCTLHHDPREWPTWCVEMVSSGVLKELLEIQQDIDVVLGKGKFDLDTALVKLKPSLASPPAGRGRDRQRHTKNSLSGTEELSPEELAAKGRRIQQIWDESLHLYRLRKENPEASEKPSRKRAQPEARPRAVSFFE